MRILEKPDPKGGSPFIIKVGDEIYKVEFDDGTEYQWNEELQKFTLRESE